MSTYKEILQSAKDVLIKQEITDADVDAWYLLAHVFGINRMEYLLNGTDIAPEEGKREYLRLIHERAKHIPLQHLTGTQEFMGLEYDVNQDVLIPRQDTEILVEEVLKVSEGKHILDMCTGSGCIIISLAKLGKIASATGVDLSDKALIVAKKNAIKLMAEVAFFQSDLFEYVEDKYDIIVSNPPYIPTEEIKVLMPEVKNHEPSMALDGSMDGLEFYRRIALESKSYLNSEGYLFFEIGHNQGNNVKRLLLKEGFADVMIKKDLSGHDRVVSARLY